jgi:hypothetical protein
MLRMLIEATQEKTCRVTFHKTIDLYSGKIIPNSASCSEDILFSLA